MRTFSTSDLSRKSGDIIASALQGPTAISQRGKPRLVVLSVEQYEALKQSQTDRRLAGATAEMPSDLAEDVSHAIDAFLSSDERP
ncbi:MAG: type II toxin-antitoxin system prevent-host-death family antitoxin [Gluconobacter potus]|uniref:Antitoxin n=1 Tax=Gluconobacter potus TaxID=2724927 RepID=A0ABR9YQZ6_9PROT|nr:MULTISPECIES: type II toxin-antitoxin system prevent-host-death family antitoxin [Gluconobacter]MBF0852235.1 type II toxin-antitoxin system Phd/YefM family antitoxin [Gluconobacter sp. R75690]MBF0865898.1 type II toxin-antitoxin system Phd/YefM family antitoxin [Gluconobacter sp. R71656]MBF0868993.1 type II toxin-antitoxin system Phd/YefM family antitoxin [Gluconobacter sp. R75628]MBF0874962.1 type II toxin-antitoxin system Phd/YefM family antitoxin [Gluconobacter sp. R75629]MBF0880939.1 ty